MHFHETLRTGNYFVKIKTTSEHDIMEGKKTSTPEVASKWGQNIQHRWQPFNSSWFLTHSIGLQVQLKRWRGEIAFLHIYPYTSRLIDPLDKWAVRLEWRTVVVSQSPRVVSQLQLFSWIGGTFTVYQWVQTGASAISQLKGESKGLRIIQWTSLYAANLIDPFLSSGCTSYNEKLDLQKRWKYGDRALSYSLLKHIKR